MAHHSSLDPGMLDLTPDIRQELQRLSEQRDLMMQKAQGYESSLEAERQAGLLEVADREKDRFRTMIPKGRDQW